MPGARRLPGVPADLAARPREPEAGPPLRLVLPPPYPAGRDTRRPAGWSCAYPQQGYAFRSHRTQPCARRASAETALQAMTSRSRNRHS